LRKAREGLRERIGLYFYKMRMSIALAEEEKGGRVRSLRAF
jgi:hypothetical protein